MNEREIGRELSRLMSRAHADREQLRLAEAKVVERAQALAAVEVEIEAFRRAHGLVAA
jgi:hypothetical protein